MVLMVGHGDHEEQIDFGTVKQEDKEYRSPWTVGQRNPGK